MSYTSALLQTSPRLMGKLSGRVSTATCWYRSGNGQLQLCQICARSVGLHASMTDPSRLSAGCICKDLFKNRVSGAGIDRLLHEFDPRQPHHLGHPETFAFPCHHANCSGWRFCFWLPGASLTGSSLVMKLSASLESSLRLLSSFFILHSQSRP